MFLETSFSTFFGLEWNKAIRARKGFSNYVNFILMVVPLIVMAGNIPFVESGFGTVS